jgi:hypothetical protein
MLAKEPGLIFVSHSSADKDLVEEVIRTIPKSHVFYDIRTLMPGAHTIQALQDAIAEASVFALFVSPNTPGSCWVEYEAALARAQKISRKELRILVCPIKGATYKDAPEWMRFYNAMPSGYTISDVARTIKYTYEDALRDMGFIKRPLFVGRETLLERVIVDCRTRPTETGVPVNFLVFAGIENMGRTSVAVR